MTMLKKLSLAAVLVSSSFASATMAADTATLNVKGTIVPVACNITLTGEADYGNITKASLPAPEGQLTLLGDKVVPMAVTCEAPALVGVDFVADKTVLDTYGIQSAVKGDLASLGVNTAGDSDLGIYRVFIDSIKYDGVPAVKMQPLIAGDIKENNDPKDATRWSSTSVNSIGLSGDGSTQNGFAAENDAGDALLPVTEMTADIVVRAYGVDAALKAESSAVSLSGSSVVSIVYL